jgi:hypothetical protein
MAALPRAVGSFAARDEFSRIKIGVLLGGQLGGTALLAPGVTIAARPRCPHAMGSFAARDELSRIKIGVLLRANSQAGACWRQM